MKNHEKLIIYFEPSQIDLPGVISITLSFSRLNEEDNTYKQKLILQRKNENGKVEKYKIKEFHIGADKILEKIREIDFDKKYDEELYEDNAETFLISYGDKTIHTSNRNQVSDILHSFRFNRVSAIPYYHYKFIHNMYEYVDLKKILKKKERDLSNEQYEKLMNILKTEDPYSVFQNMGWLEKYIERETY